MPTTDPRKYLSLPTALPGLAQPLEPAGPAADPRATAAAASKLAGGLAHGFNNLLTVIRGNAELLREVLADPRQRVMADAMLVACGRAHSLAQQLLTCSGKQVIRPQVVDLNLQVADWLQRHRLHLPADVEVRFAAGPAAPVFVDPVQVAEVMSRLTVAACDAILAVNEEGGRIDVRTERVRDPIGLPPGDYARLVIAHDGRGYDAAALASLFEPYGSVADFGDGTDLGLATVAGILRQNRGVVTCASAPGAGATFTLDWPLRNATSVLVPRSPAAGRGELVMLVDDDDGVRHFAAVALRDRGYEVVEFAAADAALRHLVEARVVPSILVTDVVMPDVDGKELALRARGLLPTLPVLYVSGYSEDIVTRDGVPGGDIPLLDKPFTGDDLAVTVRAVIDAAAAR